jgi:NAD(P)-dependent dehydrogenase (short-subunit alcohol dehydrogenase family)
MTLDFAGRVAIVTGAGRGMGRAHALMLASRGARVVVNDIGAGEANPAHAVVAEIEAAGGAAVAATDSVVGGCAAIVATAVAAFGRLDILVCNAGMMASETLADARPADWYAVFDAHFRGTVDLCREAWPHLVRSGSGRIVTVSSSGMLGNVGLTSYGAAKGGIFAFTRSLALEGEPHGIAANVILPSASTRMSDTIPDPAIAATIRTYFHPDHVSSLVTWLTHQGTHVTNEAIQVSGGRAGRIIIGAMPTVRLPESSPEIWAERGGELFADGPVKPLRTTGEMFFDELADADPVIRPYLAGAGGSVGHSRTSGRE